MAYLRKGTGNPSIVTGGIDYEEGTFTPAVASWTATVASATYTKIGRLVTIQIYMVGTGGSAPSGTTAITGMPFTTGAAGSNGTLAAFIVDQSNSYKRFPACGFTPGDLASISFNISFLENYESFTMANDDQVQIGGTYMT